MGELFKKNLLGSDVNDAVQEPVSRRCQWASTLAEKSFGINKTIGDLAGPMAFAILMGSSRAFYGKFGDKINLERFMQYSAVLCMVSYLMIAFIPVLCVGNPLMCGLRSVCRY